ncbi:DNA-binding transcriptional ArsR family regulator [Aurantimicrobium minutum]|nr:DNA-binding transcriptional ArsR family regulator [Aurantimicrobium minutum]
MGRVQAKPTENGRDSLAPMRTIDAEHVALVRASMPSVEDVADLSDVFGLLGEPNRARILISLLNGPMCVRDLAAAINLSESAVSHALRLLRAHRVVEVHRTGRVAHYTIADSHVRDLLEIGLEHVGHTILIHATTAETDRDCDPGTIPCDQ